MQLGSLDHVNIRTANLTEMIEWYEAVLGMTNGPRPDFPFAGAWLYSGQRASVHLIEVEDPGVGAESALKLEHFAFSATGRAGFEDRLRARGEPFRSSGLDELGLMQYNVWDPDGNHIHIDFNVGTAPAS